jgi:group II intron reverse transcriptase/maturase
MARIRKAGSTMQTSLRGISNRAAKDKGHRFGNLYGLLDENFLKWCFGQLKRDAAPGVDRVDFYEYRENLDENIANLVKSLKQKNYRAKLVRRQYIPKINGKLRPLGIPATDDKVLQFAVAKILEAIYEEDFLDVSYGYRRGTGPQDAVRDLTGKLQFGRFSHIVEADIRGFFDNIDHNWMIRMLEERINDRAFVRLIQKWLKAGILDTSGKVIHPATGTPQGGIVSPILANVYLHYALDLWFEKRIKRECNGEALIIRYADDFVCAFQYKQDAELFYQQLDERLGKFGLEVSPEKTRILLFSRSMLKQSETFDFLGFEFRRAISRKFKPIIRRRTSRMKLRASIAAFTEWIKTKRNKKISKLMTTLRAKYRGYWNYYGVIGNYGSLKTFYYRTIRILFKWLNRRSQRLSYNWAGFKDLLNQFLIPAPKITEKYPSKHTQLKLFV